LVKQEKHLAQTWTQVRSKKKIKNGGRLGETQSKDHKRKAKRRGKNFSKQKKKKCRKRKQMLKNLGKKVGLNKESQQSSSQMKKAARGRQRLT